MRRPGRHSLALLLLATLAFACAGDAGPDGAAHQGGVAVEGVGAPPPVDVPRGSGFLNDYVGCELPDGSFGYPVIAPEDMPWRVAIGYPKNTPKYGGRAEARQAAIESMELWEASLRTRLPWFDLEFVEKDRDADVQIVWKRRPAGNIVGKGGPTCSEGEDGRLHAGGEMMITIQSCPTCIAE